MAGKVGNLFVSLILETAKFEKGLKRTQRSLTKIGTNMTRLGTDMTHGVTLPIVAAGAAIGKFGLDFDKAMTESTAIMAEFQGETTEATKALRKEMADTAKTVSETSTFSAKQAAEAYFYLASAGLSAKESIASLPAVTKFAQAGVFDLSTATDLLTDAQSALGLNVGTTQEKYESMVRVSDVLVKANTKANATVQQFSEALTNDAAVAARLVGMEIEETVAVLAVFADQGIKGQMAGTRFAMAMRDLQSKALENTAAFEALGVAVFDENEEFRKMTDIVADLEDKMIGATDAQKKQTLATLGFTDKSQKAILSLIGFSDKIRDYESALKDAAGTTDRVAAKQMEALANKLTALWHRVQNSLIRVFESLMPTIENSLVPAIEMIVGWIESLSKAFAALPQPIQTFIVGLLAVTAAIGPLLMIGGKFIFIWKNVIGLFSMAVGPLVGFSKAATAAGGVMPLLAAKIATAKVALVGMFASLKAIMPVLMGPWGIAIAAAAAAIIYFKDDIASAIVSLGEFLGLVETTEDVMKRVGHATFEGTEAFSRLQNTLSLTAGEMKNLTGNTAETLEIFGRHREAVLALANQYKAGEITKGEYLTKLKGVVTESEKATEAVKKEGEAAAGAAPGVEGLADILKSLEGNTKSATDATANIVQQFEALLNPADEMEERLKVLVDLYSKDDIVRIYGQEIADLAEKYRELNRELPETVRKLQDFQTHTTAELGKPFKLNLDEIVEGTEKHTKAQEESIQKLIKQQKETAAYSDVAAETSREIQKWADKEIKAAEERAAWAKKWEGAWIQAAGNVLTDFGNWATKMLGIGDSFAGSLLKIFIQQLFSPLLSWVGKIGNVFGSWLGSLLPGGGSFDLGGALKGALGFGSSAAAGIATGGGAAGGGAAAGGAAGGGLGLGSLGAFFTNPWTIGVGAGIAAFFGFKKLFSKNSFKEGSKEIGRDFGVNVAKSTVESFVSGIGLNKKSFEDIRKDILSSPKFFEEVLLPAAQASGQVDQLIAKFGQLEAFGQKHDFSAAAAKAAEGDFSALNQAWVNLFEQSEKLQAALPNWRELLIGIGDAASTAADAVNDLADAGAETGTATAASGSSGEKFTISKGGGATQGVDLSAPVGLMSGYYAEAMRLYKQSGSWPTFGDLKNKGIIKGLRRGGFVDRDQFAYLHRGEMVTPRHDWNAWQERLRGIENRFIRREPQVSRGDIYLTVNSRSEDLVRTVRAEVIPLLKRELDQNTGGFTSSVVKAVNASRHGVTGSVYGAK